MSKTIKIIIAVAAGILLVILIISGNRRTTAPQPGALALQVSTPTRDIITESLRTNVMSGGDIIWIITAETGLTGVNRETGDTTTSVPLPEGWDPSTTHIRGVRGEYALLASGNATYALINTIKNSIQTLPEKIQVGSLLDSSTIVAYSVQDFNGSLIELNTTTLEERLIETFSNAPTVETISTDNALFVSIVAGTDIRNGKLYRYDSQQRQLQHLTNIEGHSFAVSPNGNTIYYNKTETLYERETILSYYYTVPENKSTRLTRTILPPLSSWSDNETLYTIANTPESTFQIVVAQQGVVTPVGEVTYDGLTSITLLNSRTLLVNTGESVQQLSL